MQSQENNAARGITGLLLYKNAEFMQLLEGEESPVQKLYSKIEKDPRHRGCNQLRRDVITERRFPSWSMGFSNLDDMDVQKTPGYSTFIDEPLTSPNFQADSSRAQKLLFLFAQK